MSSIKHTHATLLGLQLASVFRHVADLGIHRSQYPEMGFVESAGGDLINVEYLLTNRKGREYVDVYVNSDRHRFLFRQHFNYGILLELELKYLDTEGEFVSLLDTVNGTNVDHTFITELLVDFEYTISVFTEFMASNIDRLK